MEGKKPLWTEGALRKNAPAAGRKWKTASCWPRGPRCVLASGRGPSEKGPCHPLRRREKRGIALGRVFLMGFFAQDPPITYYCRSCRTLFTFLEGEPPLDEWENKGPGSARALIFRQGRNFILFSWKRPSVPGRPAPGPFPPSPSRRCRCAARPAGRSSRRNPSPRGACWPGPSGKRTSTGWG